MEARIVCVQVSGDQETLRKAMAEVLAVLDAGGVLDSSAEALAVEATPAQKKTAPVAVGRRSPPDAGDMSQRARVYRCVDSYAGTVSAAQVSKDTGIGKGPASVALATLVQQGLVERVSRGVYRTASAESGSGIVCSASTST